MSTATELVPVAIAGQPTHALPAPRFSFGEVAQMAKGVAASGLFPGIRTEQQALTLMLLCDSEGLHPMQALKRYHVIQGRPAMRADAMLASFQAAGGRVEWHERTDTRVSATFAHPAGGSARITWDLEQARRARLADKDTWKQYPRQLLTARVISEGVRTVLPGVAVGIYTPEEVADFEPVRPKPEPEHPERKADRGRARTDRREPDRSGDSGAPRTGKALFMWAKEQEQVHQVGLLKYLYSWGKLQEFPARMVDWDAEQAAYGHAEAVRKLQSIQAPADAEPAPVQPEARSESRAWPEFLGRFLAHWATLDPCDAREGEARRNRLINRLVSDAVAEGVIDLEAISRRNREGKTVRDKPRAERAICDLYEASDASRAKVRQWAKAYLDERTAPPAADTEPPAPATVLEPYDPPAGAGDAWEPDGVDLLDRWAVAQEERTGLDIGRLVAEAAQTRGLPDDPHRWSAVQIKHLVADVERIAAATLHDDGPNEGLADEALAN